MKTAFHHQFLALLLAMGACLLAGCASLPNRPPTAAQSAAIQSVFDQHTRLKTQDEPTSLLSNQRVADLMAVDVQACPAEFRAAWFDYLVQVRNLHRRTERVALFASAAGKPVTTLPELIKVAVTSPALGQYLLDAVNQDDAAWEKVERSAMNYGVMPKP
jgi:hypothetical protein